MSAAGFWGWRSRWLSSQLEILVVPCEYMLVDGIANDRNRGSYFGAHSFSTIGNFIGPTLGGAMLGAFGGAGMFCCLPVLRVSAPSYFPLAHACRLRKQQHREPHRARWKLRSDHIVAAHAASHESRSGADGIHPN